MNNRFCGQILNFATDNTLNTPICGECMLEKIMFSINSIRDPKNYTVRLPFFLVIQPF